MTSTTPTDPPLFATDMKGLMNQLKDIDLSGTIGRTSELTMDDILNKMSEAKLKAKIEKDSKRPIAKYEPPGGWKQTTSTRKESNSTTLAKLAMTKKSKLRTVAAFRTNELKWDGSSTLDSHVEKEIYRTPCRDPSGIFYRNLGREPYRGDKKWKPTSVDTDLPDVTMSMLTDSFRTRLVVHISTIVTKEKYIFDHMPITTDAQRNAKAKHGADLNNLEMVKTELLDSIMQVEKEEKEKELLKSKSKSTKK